MSHPAAWSHQGARVPSHREAGSGLELRGGEGAAPVRGSGRPVPALAGGAGDRVG